MFDLLWFGLFATLLAAGGVFTVYFWIFICAFVLRVIEVAQHIYKERKVNNEADYTR